LLALPNALKTLHFDPELANERDALTGCYETQLEPCFVKGHYFLVGPQGIEKACFKNQFCNKGTALAGPKNAGKYGALAPAASTRQK
jgi:hypothetical protein